EPGTWGQVLAVAGYGQWVEIWDGPNWAGWYYVDFQGVAGWVFGQHLLWGGEGGQTAVTGPSVTTAAETQPAATTAAVVPTAGGMYSAWVNTDAVAIRTEPNQN